MKAIIIRGKIASVESDRPLPKPRDDYILVKPFAIALNPTDWKMITDGLAHQPFGLSGCDYAGTVEQVGPAVPRQWTKGDRICGCAHGANFSNGEDGVFAEYAMVKGDLQMRIPSILSDEKAATVSLGSITCGQGLFQKNKGLGMNLPTDPTQDGEFVLIYGGSTATGSLGIQFARLAGYTVLATCSPRNDDFVKGRGVTKTFDYNDKDVGAKIRQYTDNKLHLAWDTIGLPESAQICVNALSSDGTGTKYCSTLHVNLSRDDVENHSTLMYTMFGEKFEKRGRKFEASVEDHEFARMWMTLTEGLLAESKLLTHPERVGDGGLEGALKGMEDMKQGRVSREKLVYLVQETP